MLLFRRGCRLQAARHAVCPAMFVAYTARLFVRSLQACTRHGTAPTASAALGRALLGSLLMGCFREETEKTQVTFNGNGILSGIQVNFTQSLLDWCIACLQLPSAAMATWQAIQQAV